MIAIEINCNLGILSRSGLVAIDMIDRKSKQLPPSVKSVLMLVRADLTLMELSQNQGSKTTSVLCVG